MTSDHAHTRDLQFDSSSGCSMVHLKKIFKAVDGIQFNSTGRWGGGGGGGGGQLFLDTRFLSPLYPLVRLSLVAHQAGAYPAFSSIKRLGVFLLLLGWDATPIRTLSG